MTTAVFARCCIAKEALKVGWIRFHVQSSVCATVRTMYMNHVMYTIQRLNGKTELLKSGFLLHSCRCTLCIVHNAWFIGGRNTCSRGHEMV